VSLGLIGAGAPALLGWRPATMAAPLLGLAPRPSRSSRPAWPTSTAPAPRRDGRSQRAEQRRRRGRTAAVAAGIVVLGDWRVGYLLLLAAIVLLASHPGAAHTDHPMTCTSWAARASPGPMLGRWITLLLSISVEFCMVFCG
jgi:hypothetical protein